MDNYPDWVMVIHFNGTGQNKTVVNFDNDEQLMMMLMMMKLMMMGMVEMQSSQPSTEPS